MTVSMEQPRTATVTEVHEPDRAITQPIAALQEGKADSSSDENDLDADETRDDGVLAGYDVDADSLVGVSIGRAQTDLKSPTSPAATRAQVLDASKNYFEAEPDGENLLFEEPPEQQTSHDSGHRHQKSSSDFAAVVPQQPPSSTQVTVVKDQTQKRSSLVSSFLGTIDRSTRTRSSSGSSIADNMKKWLPGFPSLPEFKFSSSTTSEKLTLKPIGLGDQQLSSGIPSWQDFLQGQKNMRDNFRNLMNTRHGEVAYNGQEDSVPASRQSQPGLLRRATSDQSLYLRRVPTGASDFDDYTAFNTSEPVNSRFKAITDSFQDSSFRRPRILGASQREGQAAPSRNNGDKPWTNTPNDKGVAQQLDINHDQSTAANADFHTSKHPILKDALARLRGDLVIMGGYRGSILRDAQPPHRQLWVPIKVGMNLRKADLEVGLTRKDELEMEEKIIAGGALSHIGPVDICRRLLRKCKKSRNVQNGDLRVHDYGYDWRLSPDLLSDRLIKFLESLPCNRATSRANERGAWLVSHSLGGLLTRHVINRRPDLIAGVVYAGTPQNCINILGPLRNGDDVLFSSRVLTAQVNFTLRTSYALLPQNGRCFLNKQTGERYDIDFFDVKTWEEYRLTPCIKSPLHRQKPEKRMSILDSISEVISQPTKRAVWLLSSSSNREDETENSHTEELSSVPSQIEEKAHEATSTLESAVEAAKPERPLSPSLGNSFSQSAQYKPSIATQSTIPLSTAMEYLSRTLGEILQFKKGLTHHPSQQSQNAYPPAAILFAKNTPTVYGAFVASREAIKYDDAFDDLAFAAGDGVVLASAAQLPAGYRCVRNGRVESDRGHVGLLGDLEGVGKCLSAVMDARERGVGIGAYEKAEFCQPETCNQPAMAHGTS